MNSNQTKAIIITAMGIFLIILLFIITSVFITKKYNDNNYNPDISGGYTSIEQIIQANGCKYIKDFVEKNDEYPIQIELGFKYDLYDGEQSNEKAYMKIINEVAKFVRYENIKMVDEEKNITIEINCLNNKIDNIRINGIDDYFIYKDSQINMSKYKEIKSINLDVTSELLSALIDNNWESGIDCGTRDSIFRNYHIFFDEGIEYKKIGSKIYNIIFTKNYQKEVISDIKPDESIASVKLKLGEPSFEDKELGIIGYKGNNFYVFFTGKEISIYKNSKMDYSEFWKLVDQFIKKDDSMEFKEFMNELTYIWPDYSDYTYNSDYMFISYPNKGIDIKFNYENEDGIIIYNNISENMDKVRRYLNNTEFISRLQIDNVFLAEKRRIEGIKKLNEDCDNYIKELKKDLKHNEELACGESNLFSLYMDIDDNNFVVTTYFVSKTGDEVNRELNEPVNSYVWINDNFFVYGIQGKGIYCYNVFDGSKQTLVEGENNFEIKSFEDNVIYYDNEEILISL